MLHAAFVLILAALTATPPDGPPAAPSDPEGAQAPRAATRAKGPMQEAMAWLAADGDSAAPRLVASGREQVAAFFRTATDQPDLTARLMAVVSPAASARAGGGTVTVAGSTVTIEMPNTPRLQFLFDGESTVGDRAYVPLTIRSGTESARGSIELALENGTWQIAAADLGPSARWPRFDSPAFVPETVERITAALRKTRIETLAARARAAVQSVQAAETAAQSANGGFFLPLECLTKPKGCLPAYSGEPPLRELPALDGYTPTFVPGAAPTPAQLTRAKASRRSVRSWAFFMRPATDDLPPFCADSTGKVCELARPASATTPACPKTCR